MKNIIKLGMLAALAGISAYANPVSFTGSASNQATIVGTPSGVSLRGYFWNGGGSTWLTANVSQDALGTGVVGIAGVDTATEGSWQEYILLDFSGTATSTVQINSLVLNYPSHDPAANPQVLPQSPYFKYTWLNTLPSGNTPNAGASPYTTNIGAFTNYTTAGTNTSGDLFSFSSVPGTGRYLLLGAINGSLNTTNYFQVNSVSYTSVPDGASTLALMGVALATFGFASRRRKA